MSLFPLVLGAYVVLVTLVGWFASRRAARSPEEYFVAGKGLGTAVLFMALFGTNCTAFVLVGIPGRAYHDGVGVFSVNAPIVALGIPLTFWLIGAPARRLARKVGALTPAELYSRRLGSRAVGGLLFGVFTLYTLPYMVTAVDGAARTLQAVLGAPQWLGGLGVLLVALLYTSLGGMRATAWTNVLQGALFMGFMLVGIVFVARSLGGFGAASQAVLDHDPDLLVLPRGGLYEAPAFASWSLAISLTVIAFPHMLVRLFAAKSEDSLKRICQLYPLALAALWLPAVLLGVWGAAAHPGLEGSASDAIFSIMAREHLPPILTALGFLAVLAAVMSTLDAQLLTLGSMLTRDVLDPERPSAHNDVAIGRGFGVLVALAVFLLWQLLGDSIFGTASIAFSGYVTLAPTLFLGVRWARFDARGAIASILVGNAVYFLSLSGADSLAGAALRPSWLGFLPVFWGFVAAAMAGLSFPFLPGGRSHGGASSTSPGGASRAALSEAVEES